MKRLWTIIKREYLTRVKTKGFVISTVALPLFIIAVTILPAVLATTKSEATHHIAVVDDTGEITEKLSADLDRTNRAGQRVFVITGRQRGSEDLDAFKEKLQQEVLDKELFGFLVFPGPGASDQPTAFYAQNVSNFQLNHEIKQAVSQIIRNRRIRNEDLDPRSVEKIMRPVPFSTFRVAPGGEEAEEEKGQTFFLAYILAFSLYMALVLYGTFVMRAVVEDKTSKTVELLVSSVKPSCLMAGKIAGVGSVGLTQLVIWATAGFLITTFSGAILLALGFAGGAVDLPETGLTLPVFFFFVSFFFLGYVLYASLYATVGALVSSDQEGQYLQMPVTMLLIIPILFMGYVIGNPGTTTSTVLSLIPFFSPMIMFTRIVVEMPSADQILLSLLLLAGTILLVVFLGGRVFRVAILMTGKKPKLREIARWMFTA